jgi:hypothetical protein
LTGAARQSAKDQTHYLHGVMLHLCVNNMKTFRENPEGEANQKAERETKVAMKMAQRKQFCLKCGATHYSEICPFCDSDAQEEL